MSLKRASRRLTVADGRNAGVEAFLATDAVSNVFPLYVARAAPAAPALVAARGARICGTVVSGVASGVRVVPASWLVAETAGAARALFEDLARRAAPPELSFRLAFALSFRSVFPKLALSRDAFHVLAREPVVSSDPSFRCALVTSRSIRDYRLSDDLRAVVGSPATIPSEGFFGLLEGDVLVATADSIVDIGGVATIQQVYTTPSRRGRGLATRLVGEVARRLHFAGKRVTYLASEDNLASMRVAERCGFSVAARLCYHAGPAIGPTP